MKKLIALIMAAVMVMSLGTAAFAASYDHITVGSTTQMRGDFFTDMWGNATSDSDVRLLLHGYDLVTWDDEQSEYKADPTVVTSMNMKDSGDHTYTISLARDLYYSDGTPITAKDYAFSLLLQMSPVIKEMGGAPLRREHILGAGDYAEGKTNVLSGVSVKDDYTLSITLDGAYLPFYFEEGLLSCSPYPISVIAPGCEVKDDGNGVYLEGDLTAAGIDGYRSNPSVVSGPYKLVSFDGTTAELERNTYYKGNALGKKPQFEKITFTLAENDTMISKLQNGEFTLLNKVTQADAIDAGLKAAGVESVSYPRVGLSYIAFCCEKDAVASQAVRQAIAWSMDRDAVAKEYTGNHGEKVDGYFGTGQWMYEQVSGTAKPLVEKPKNTADAAAMAKYEKELAEWKALKLDGITEYTLDVQKAVSLLEADGWNLNADGIREKDGVKLELTLIYPEGNKIGEIFESKLVPNLNQEGIRLTLKAVPMPELLGQYYKQTDREADMIYLGSNFDELYDPSAHFQTGADGETYWAFTNQQDEELYKLAVAMRQTQPDNALEYVKKWIAFEERFSEVLPVLPIYSNEYYDFYTAGLKDYEVAAEGSWARAIVGATLG